MSNGSRFVVPLDLRDVCAHAERNKDGDWMLVLTDGDVEVHLSGGLTGSPQQLAGGLERVSEQATLLASRITASPRSPDGG